MAELVAVDLDLLRATANAIEVRSETGRLLQLRALADELESHLNGELDFVEEAHNTEVIGRLVAGEADALVVPRVVRPWVTERVLVLERIHGQRVGPQHGLGPERAAELARTFFRAYVRQVTIEGIYHADPHQGNVLLTDDGRLALLDFGLLGRLDDDTRRNLALLLRAVAQNRADDVAAFVHDLRRKLPRYHWRPLSGIATGDALADLQRLAVRHGIRLPTSFALVGKTLAQADSIALTLDPELDPVRLLESESLEVLMVEAERRLAPRQLLGTAYTQLEPLTKLPRSVGMLLSRLEEGSLKVGIAQSFALIPGMSRSGATIIGGMLFGLSRRAATEFSFFLAVPTLVAAGAYDFYKHRALLDSSDLGVFAVGFVVSFVSAFLCIRWLLRYIATHDFSVFAWYRIVFGLIVLATGYAGLVSWSA